MGRDACAPHQASPMYLGPRSLGWGLFRLLEKKVLQKREQAEA